MKQIPTHDPKMLEFRSGGECLTSIFGLPFLAAGLGIMSLPWTTSPANWSGGQQSPWYFLVPFGGIFAAVGAALAFGRRGAIFDLGARTLTTWWGLLIPFHAKTRPLDADAVGLTAEIRRTKNNSYTVYPVRVLRQSREFYKSGEWQDLRQARAHAELLAKFLHVPLTDQSAGTKIVREPDTLDEPLSERLKRLGEAQKELPPQPTDLRAEYAADADRLLVRTPPAEGGLILRIVFGAAVGGEAVFMIIAAVFLWPIFTKSGLSPVWLVAGLLLLGAFSVGALSFALLGAAKRRHEIQASPDGLLVAELTLRRQERFIPAEQLEELFIGDFAAVPRAGGRLAAQNPFAARDRPVLIARSDRETLVFGAGLSRGELAWLKALIEKALTR